VNALFEQVCERMIDRALPLDAAQACEGGRLDFDSEVTFAARVVAGVAAMFLAVVNDLEVRRAECLSETFGDFCGDGAG
jgi:hypothetical protein